MIVVLIILWGLGLVFSVTMSCFTYILLVLAVVILAIRLIRGRRS
ncbi:lmo0937 family membrane protein [Alishewanella sp. 16-MA]|uniref:Lmo0937 family membrane protein n=1 Tax=Alishewanella maricola TaxID=2795740 RepID=A0ABS8C4J1_9ALTE|nr:lmo0937 family membrane protein [Alishewanella maricola]